MLALGIQPNVIHVEEVIIPNIQNNQYLGDKINTGDSGVYAICMMVPFWVPYDQDCWHSVNHFGRLSDSSSWLFELQGIHVVQSL